MKRIFLLPIVIILFVSNATAQQEKNDWTKLKLKGKVKTISESFYNTVVVREFQKEVEVGVLKKGLIIGRTTSIFNSAGYMIEFEAYNKKKIDSTLQQVSKKTYNYKYNKGKLIEFNTMTEPEFIHRTVDGFGGNSMLKEIYTYNFKGNVTESNTYGDDGRLIAKEIYKYDIKGIPTEHNYYNGDGSLEEKKTYNNRGFLIEDSYYDENRSLKGRDTFIYNNAGNLIEKKYYDESETLVSTTKYDAKGNEIEEIEKGDSVKKRKYDIKGNMIEEMYYINGSLNRSMFFKYDNYGNETERYASDGLSVSLHKYVYDKNLNWIKMSVLGGEKGDHIIERNITYFPAVVGVSSPTTHAKH